jgi:hypothetical protein
MSVAHAVARRWALTLGGGAIAMPLTLWQHQRRVHDARPRKQDVETEIRSRIRTAGVRRRIVDAIRMRAPPGGWRPRPVALGIPRWRAAMPLVEPPLCAAPPAIRREIAPVPWPVVLTRLPAAHCAPLRGLQAPLPPHDPPPTAAARRGRVARQVRSLESTPLLGTGFCSRC